MRLSFQPSKKPLIELSAVLLAELSTLGVSFPQILMGTGLALLLGLMLSSIVVTTTKQDRRKPRSRHWISRLIYVVYLLLIAVLALTAFGSLLQFGHLSGYPLLAHVAASGAFVFLMVAIAFLYLPSEAVALDARNLRVPSWWAERWSVWGLVVSSLAVAATMLVSMLPWLDTQGLRDMALIHRYAGLAVVVFAILHLFSTICCRLGWR